MTILHSYVHQGEAKNLFSTAIITLTPSNGRETLLFLTPRMGVVSLTYLGMRSRHLTVT